MAKILSDVPAAAPHGRDRYPAEWFDGKWRLLTAGEDYPADKLVESAARKFRKEAKEKNLQGEAVILSPTTFRARVH